MKKAPDLTAKKGQAPRGCLLWSDRALREFGLMPADQSRGIDGRQSLGMPGAALRLFAIAPCDRAARKQKAAVQDQD
jgi:hypothetical protein